jgi:tetratricopeptide (TPR) repeat protein
MSKQKPGPSRKPAISPVAAVAPSGLPERPGTHRSISPFLLLQLAAILITGLLAYSNTFDASFHYDDAYVVDYDPAIKHFDLKGIFAENPLRCVANLTFAVNYRLGGRSVTGYHIVNFTIHLLAAFCVFFLVVLLLRTPAVRDKVISHSKWLPLSVALVFMLHPVQTQAVTYIVQRYASLAALFYLLSMTLYLKNALGPVDAETNGRRPRLYYALSLACCLLAMFTKAIAATLPLAIVMLELFFFTPSLKRMKTRLPGLFPFLACLPLIPVFLIIIKPAGGISTAPLIPGDAQVIPRLHYLFTQFNVIPGYLRLLFLPVNQNLDHHVIITESFFQWPTPLYFLGLAGLVLLAVWRFEKDRLFSFGLLFFFLALSVESSIIPIYDPFVEHRLYLPLFGFMLAVLYAAFNTLPGLLKNQGNRPVLLMALLFPAALLAFTTYQRNKVWKNDITLWEDVTRKSPARSRGHNNLGLAYKAAGRLNDAVAEYQQAIRCRPDNASAFNNLGILYAEKRMTEAAVAEFQRAISADPGFGNAYANLGLVYLQTGRNEQALAACERALKLSPNSADAFLYRGMALEKTGNADKAMSDYQRAGYLNPENPEIPFCLGNLWFRKGDYARALQAFQQALALNPRHFPAWNAVGLVYMNEGRYSEALEVFRALLKADPGQAGALANIGTIYKNLGKPDAAIQQYLAALQLAPGNAEILANLGLTYIATNRMQQGIRAIQQSLQRDSSGIEIFYYLGNSYLRMNALDSAIIAFEKVIKKDPAHIRAWNDMGVALAEKGRFQDAREAFLTALRIKPDFADAKNNLARVVGRK